MRVSKERREALRDAVAKADDDRCGYAVTDAEGIEEPCDLPTTGLRWYDHCGHEPMLDPACCHHEDEGGRLIGALVSDLDDAEQRAERAEAELAALRDRARGMAHNADRWAAMSLSRDFTGKPFLPASVTTDDLRDLLDDDTTGAASGEGEK